MQSKEKKVAKDFGVLDTQLLVLSGNACLSLFLYTFVFSGILYRLLAFSFVHTNHMLHDSWRSHLHSCLKYHAVRTGAMSLRWKNVAGGRLPGDRVPDGLARDRFAVSRDDQADLVKMSQKPTTTSASTGAASPSPS